MPQSGTNGIYLLDALIQGNTPFVVMLKDMKFHRKAYSTCLITIVLYITLTKPIASVFKSLSALLGKDVWDIFSYDQLTLKSN